MNYYLPNTTISLNRMRFSMASGPIPFSTYQISRTGRAGTGRRWSFIMGRAISRPSTSQAFAGTWPGQKLTSLFGLV